MSGWRRLLGRTPSPADAASPEPALAELQRELEVAHAIDEERRRIYDDLHDDIGSRLLTLLHRVQEPGQQQMVREILQDLRAILARDRGIEGTLLEVLAQLREETEQRLLTRDIELDWRQADDLPDPPLHRAQGMHLFRIGRESVTNAMRHAPVARLRVVVALQPQGKSRRRRSQPSQNRRRKSRKRRSQSRGRRGREVGIAALWRLRAVLSYRKRQLNSMRRWIGHEVRGSSITRVMRSVLGPR